MSSEYSKALLNEVLEAVAAELVELASMSAAVQVVISPLLEDGDLEANGAYSRIQELDLITQGLGEIAAFLVRLGLEAPLEYRFDTAGAAASVKLCELAQRLSCQPQQASMSSVVAAGDADWL